LREGGKIATGGRRPLDHDVGYFFEPTVFIDAPLDGFVWNEEIFGPVVCLRSFQTEDEAVRLANDTPYGLAAAVMSSDPTRLDRVASELDAGILWVNCSQPTFVERLGGMKQSGIGASSVIGGSMRIWRRNRSRPTARRNVGLVPASIASAQ